MIYVALAELAVLAGLVWMNSRERAAHHRAVVDLLEQRPTPDLQALIALTDRLCQRIQAPQQAVVDHALAQPVPPVPPTIHPTSTDEQFWEAMNLPKDQLAEQLMAEEINGG